MPKAPGPSEHAIQAAFIEWVRMNQGRIPELATLHAIPNGAALARAKDPRTGKWSRGTAQAAKLAREGLLPGTPDIHLPVRGGGGLPNGTGDLPYIGLWLEFKRPGEEMSDRQLEVAALLTEFGHLVQQVESTEEAIDVVEAYLDIPPSLRTLHFGTNGTGD